MSVTNIEQKKWEESINTFSRLHKNWYSDMKEIDADGDERILNKDFRLKEIILDLEKGEYNNVAYIKGKKEEEEINHVVMNIKNISIEKDEEGNHKSIILGSENGKITSVEFRTTQPSARLNGIV